MTTGASMLTAREINTRAEARAIRTRTFCYIDNA